VEGLTQEEAGEDGFRAFINPIFTHRRI